MVKNHTQESVEFSLHIKYTEKVYIYCSLSTDFSKESNCINIKYGAYLPIRILTSIFSIGTAAEIIDE